ncbi:MAG: hypothetical protein KY475_18950 [Planctomycetes bacterium]|nr:hypothetical protein [Planctomycetota bacterium]
MAALYLRRVMGVAVLALSAATPAAGEESLRNSTSLSFVPADAAFFRACLRTREQFDAVVESEAMRRVAEAPNMARWLAMVREQWQDPDRGGLKAWLEQPENRELAEFAIDAVSHEIFWYGDAAFADALDLSAYVNQSAASAQLAALRQGRSPEEAEQAAANAALRILAQDPDGLCVPAVVVGFKVTDADRAQRQLARLEEGLKSLLAQQTELGERLRREQVAGAEFLTWRLDGSLLPWDLVSKGDAKDADPRLRERLQAVLKTKKATVSLGVLGDYLLLSVGEDNQHLATLGQGPLLIDRPELAPLRDMGDRPVTGVVYVSQAYRERAAAANQHQLFGSFFVEELLKHPKAQGEHLGVVLDEKTRADLTADLKLLAQDISAAAWSHGASLRFTFLTPRGYEGYWYDWSENGLLDPEQPLTILDHVGDNPVAFFALRRKVTGEDYDQTVKWVGKAESHFERIVVPQWAEPQQASYASLREQWQALWAELDRATREMILPALDGQSALVLTQRTPRATESAEGESAEPPRSESPRLALALMCGVSDAEKFQEGLRTYLAVAREVWEGVRDLIHDVRAEARAETGVRDVALPEIPDSEILLPEKRDLTHGTMWLYSLPDWRRNAEPRAPNLALSDEFVVLSLRPEVSARLLESGAFEDAGPLADLDRALAAAAYLDFPQLVDVVQPRLEKAVDRARERRAEREREARAEAGSRTPSRAATPRAAPAAASRVPTPPPATRSSTPASRRVEESQTPHDDKPALRLALDVLRCFRGFACATYAEGDATVTHYELRFQDMAREETKPRPAAPPENR